MQRRAPMTLLAWWFVPFIVVSAAHVILLGVDSELAGPTKIALMPLLALPVAAFARRLRPRAAVILLFAALLFSWLGDSAGAFVPTAPELPLMLGFFGLAHIAYIVLFARHVARRRMPWWALLYAAWWGAMLITLGPHTGGLLIAVAVYGLILAGTAAFAARCHPAIAVGGAFFLASDTILALRLFLPGGLPAWSDPAIMFTYTLGQGLIVAGAMLALQKRSADA
jgi:hypothetical protein